MKKQTEKGKAKGKQIGNDNGLGLFDESELEKLAEADIKKLGAAFKARRIELGYTSQETFANDKGIGRTQYNQWEQGKNLSFSNLMRMFRALEIKPSEFFKRYFE